MHLYGDGGEIGCGEERGSGLGDWGSGLGMGAGRDDIGKRASRGCTWGTSRVHTEDGLATGDNIDQLERMRPVDKDKDKDKDEERAHARASWVFDVVHAVVIERDGFGFGYAS